jgi:hypothetical protein
MVTDLDTGTGAVQREGAVVYSFRPSLMSPPREFALEPHALHWEIGRHAGRMPYRSIRRIRLSYRPMTLQMHRFQLEIWSDAPKLTIASTSWRSMVEMERQDAPYRAFVLALHRRIDAAGGTPLLSAGSPAFAYWPGVAIFAAMAMVLPWTLTKVARADVFWQTALLALIIAVFLWQIGSFFWRNRPRSYDIAAPPEAVLPKG